MNRLNDSFDKNIINQYYYNNYLRKLEIIHENYKKMFKLTLKNWLKPSGIDFMSRLSQK